MLCSCLTRRRLSRRGIANQYCLPFFFFASNARSEGAVSTPVNILASNLVTWTTRKSLCGDVTAAQEFRLQRPRVPFWLISRDRHRAIYASAPGSSELR